MTNRKSTLNNEVTEFLEVLVHPMKAEIRQLREAVLTAHAGLTENIKWNSPNFCFRGEDRITMKIQPPKQLQLVFHRGAKVLQQPKNKLIFDDSGLLIWKTNDRAIATFENAADIATKKPALTKLVNEWITATT